MLSPIVLNDKGERCIQLDLQVLAQYFTCSVCHELLDQAVTITECTHTFCEACIGGPADARLRKCPECAASFTPAQVCVDYALRSLRDKIFSSQAADSSAKRVKQQQQQQEDNSPRIPSPPPPAAVMDSDEKITLSLVCHATTTTTNIASPPPPPPILISIASHFSVYKVRRYLAKRFSLAPQQVSELCCLGKALAEADTVQQVKHALWKKKEEAMEWTFSI